METKLRPIPVTLLDFLAILLPGFIWLVLIVTTFMLIPEQNTAIITPVSAWERLVTVVKVSDSWFAPISLLIISLLIGYLLKPVATPSADFLTRLLFKVYGKHKKVPWKELSFPFVGIYKQYECYHRVKQLLRDKLNCAPQALPGSRTFAAAKRTIKLVAPTLWEESERAEAEVRMSGVMLLASLYSTLLSISVLSLRHHDAATWAWLVLSVLASLILGANFNRLRIREVGYTYINFLIANGYRDLIDKERVPGS
jgi:hypothetical protein